MFRLPLRQVWTQQPQQPARVDWANPLTRGLELCANPANGFRETITGATFGTFGAAPVISKNPRGTAYDSRGGFGGLTLAQTKSVATAASTQFVLTDYESKAGAYSGLFCISSADGATAFSGIQDCGSATYGFYPTSVGWWDSTVPSSNFGIKSVALAGNATDSRIYTNGEELSQVASALSPLSTSRLVLFGERVASASYAVKGRIYLYLAWSRRLSAAEIKTLSANPWQIFKRPDSSIWVPVSGGGGMSATADGGTGSGAGSGSGGAASGQVSASAPGGTGTGVGSGTGGAATGGSGSAGAADGGTGAGTGSGSGGNATGAAGGAAAAQGGTGIGAGSGSGGSATGQISAVAAGGAGAGTGSGTGGAAAGLSSDGLAGAGTGTGAGSGSGGSASGAGSYARAPSGAGSSINKHNTRRPAQRGGRRR